MSLGYQVVRRWKLTICCCCLPLVASVLSRPQKPGVTVNCAASFLPYNSPHEDKPSHMTCQLPEKSQAALICDTSKCKGTMVCQTCSADLTGVHVDSAECTTYSKKEDNSMLCITYDNTYFTCTGSCTGGAQCSGCESKNSEPSNEPSNKTGASAQVNVGDDGVKTWLPWI